MLSQVCACMCKIVKTEQPKIQEERFSPRQEILLPVLRVVTATTGTTADRKMNGHDTETVKTTLRVKWLSVEYTGNPCIHYTHCYTDKQVDNS